MASDSGDDDENRLDFSDLLRGKGPVERQGAFIFKGNELSFVVNVPFRRVEKEVVVDVLDNCLNMAICKMNRGTKILF